MDQEPKQIIVVRKDLNMRKGKIAAQAAHASMKAVLDRVSRLPFDDIGRGIHWSLITIEGSSLHTWLTGRFTKICVSVDSEEELLDTYIKAEQQGMMCSLITDAGLTEFNGVPTKTCCAIGPDLPSKIDPITGHLKLL